MRHISFGLFHDIFLLTPILCSGYFVFWCAHIFLFWNLFFFISVDKFVRCRHRHHPRHHRQVKLTKIIDLIDNNDEQNVRNCDVTMPIQFDNGEWDAMSTAGDYLLIVCLFFRVYSFCLLFSFEFQYTYN